ncbi:MAG: PAS domain S-box protein [Candidatus Thermoplasmatota archaeon]|nr:PAS domain S-box protein [Candidatus Thermoplasmatota archaeon]
MSHFEEKFRSMFDNASDGILFLDTSGRILNVNESVVRMFGDSSDELVGRRLSDIGVLSPEQISELEKCSSDALAGKKVLLPLHIRNRKGEEIDIDYSANLVRSGDKVVGVMVTVRDVTKRRELKDKIRETERQLGDLNSLLLAIRNINQCITSETDKKILLERACYSLADTRGYMDISIAYLDKDTNELRPVAHRGNHERRQWKASPTGEGDAPKCVRYLLGEQSSVLYRSTREECGECDCCDYEVDHQSVLVPIMTSGGPVIGLIHVCFETERDIHKDEIGLLEELAADLALGISKIEAEEALREYKQELEIRNKIDEIFLTISDERMYGEVLDVVLKTMGSKYGIFGYIHRDGAFVSPSLTKDIWDQCQMKDKDIVFPRETWGGIWGRALMEKRTLCSNGGFKVPKGHIPVTRALDVPIIHRNEVIGNLLVSNKTTDYDNKDVELLENIANGIAPILNARLQRDRQEEDRKEAEENLRQSEERFRSIVEGAPGVLVIADTEGNNVYVSPNSEEITGLTPEELLGGFVSWVHEDDRPKAEEAFDRTFSEGIGGRDFEYKAVRKNGEVWYASSSWEPLKDAQGDFAGVVLQTTNITERKEAEEKMKRSEERFRNLVENTEAAIATTDIEGKFNYVNDALCRTIGYSREELLGEFFGDFIHPDDGEKIVEVFLSAFEDPGKTVHLEFSVICKDGHEVRLSSTPTALTRGDEVVGFSAIVTDITDLKQAEETKNRLISNISHELRTPLTSIEGYAGFMLSGKTGKLPENHRKSVSIIVEESERLRVLIDNFLDLITIDVEGLEMETATVSIGRIIESLVSSMTPELKKKEIRISKRLPSNLRPLRGDESRLHQLFSNLLSNAIKFTPAGGSVEIRASASDEHITVEVADTGTGISAEDMPHIFDRFYQADNSSTRVHRGAGLGLAICKEIVEAHTGRIEVESEPRSGSVFRVILPLGEEDPDV